MPKLSRSRQYCTSLIPLSQPFFLLLSCNTRLCINKKGISFQRTKYFHYAALLAKITILPIPKVYDAKGTFIGLKCHPCDINANDKSNVRVFIRNTKSRSIVLSACRYMHTRVCQRAFYLESRIYFSRDKSRSEHYLCIRVKELELPSILQLIATYRDLSELIANNIDISITSNDFLLDVDTMLGTQWFDRTVPDLTCKSDVPFR
jgi:hypothetical protein